jgi:IMP dehydrogenase
MGRAFEALRRRHPSVPLVAGNVGTGEGASFLRDLGADAIKVGIGPGRGCRTRLETAAGVPQLQAIREAWHAVGEDVPIIADGGLREDKDLFLALLCGASTVMLGRMLAGTDEAPGTVIEDPHAAQAQDLSRHDFTTGGIPGALRRQRAEGSPFETPAEGQEMEVPYRAVWWTSSTASAVTCARRSAMAAPILRAALREEVVPNPVPHPVPLSAAARREPALTPCCAERS